jgi:CRP/FNR family transcriptional regulator, nitrogen oxide reductase regulator
MMDDYLYETDTFLQSDLFAGIAKEKHGDIFRAGQHRLVTSGVTLFQEGRQALLCYFVRKDRLKLTKLHEEGKEVIIRYINPGEITAAVAVFSGKNYPVTATAVRTTDVVGWNRETMLDLMSVHAPLAINLLHAVVERLDDIQSRYLEMRAERVEQRIARALLSIMRQSGRKTDDGILIDFAISCQDLADYSGTTLYKVSRTLSTWEKKGWIKSGRERIVVTDVPVLENIAESG